MDAFDILHVSLDTIVDDKTIENLSVGVGDDVFICGMYLSRIGETRNLPIVRAGIISAMPSEMIRTSYGYHQSYLVEARSTGGLSGSPVFLQIPPFRLVNEDVRVAAGIPPQYFLGMVLGINKLSYPPELIPFLPSDEREAEDKADDDYEKSIPLNTGIALVLPAPYIIQAVMHPWILSQRSAAHERARKRSGYTPQSAIHIDIGDENPNV